jgi:autotransporter-associated beta strand protein
MHRAHHDASIPLFILALLAGVAPSALGASYEWIGGSGAWDTTSPS